MDELEKKIKQLGRLKQYKNKTTEELKKIALRKLEEEKYKVEWVGLAKDERKEAKSLFGFYRKEYNIESVSDVDCLKILVYKQMLVMRIQKKLEDFAKATVKEVGDIVPPRNVIESLKTLQDDILTLKDKLGLFEEKRQDDPFEYIQRLKKKFEKWREENQGSRTAICPYCSKMILFKIRIDKYEVGKHPFFKDKILINDHLWKLYKQKKILKSDVAKVLQVSDDYIDWLEKKVYNNVTRENN